MPRSHRSSISRPLSAGERAARKQRALKQFVALVALVVLASVWVDHHSNFLPKMALVLGGSGVAVLIPSVYAIVGPEIKATISNMLAGFFGSRILSSCLWIISLGFVVLCNVIGSVQVDAVSDTPKQTVHIDGCVSHSENEWLELAISEPVRCPAWTSWWSPKQVTVKVRGYPSKTVKVRPFNRTSLPIPDGVRTVVLFIRPTPLLSQLAGTMRLQMQVGTARSSNAKLVPFDGGALLLGGNDLVEVPNEISDEWKRVPGITSKIMEGWRHPYVVNDFELLQNEAVDLQMIACSSAPCQQYGSKISVLVEPRATGTFVQEVIIHAPSELTKRF